MESIKKSKKEDFTWENSRIHTFRVITSPNVSPTGRPEDLQQCCNSVI